MCTPLPVSALRYAGSVATSVLPSPVAISAIVPLCSTMPPMSCTSKCRMPTERRAASRQTANASGSTSSISAPSASRLRSSSVLPRRAASSRAWMAGSSALISATTGIIRLTSRSCLVPKIFLRIASIIAGALYASASRALRAAAAQERARVLEGGGAGGVAAAEHPRDLGRALVAGHQAGARARAAPADALGHAQGLVREGGDRRQVRDAEDLPAGADGRELLADHRRGAAADPRVHLVEHHGRRALVPGEDDLQRQHAARQFPPGGDARQRPYGLAGVAREAELHALGAARPPPRQRRLDHRDLERRPLHPELPQLALHSRRERRRRLAPRGAERARGGGHLDLELGEPPLVLAQQLLVPLQAVQLGRRLGAEAEHRLLAVGVLEPAPFRPQPLLLARAQPRGVQLGHLEAQEVLALRAVAPGAAAALEVLPRLAVLGEERGEALAQRLGVGEPVQQVELARGLEQALVLVLAVDLDERVPEALEQADRHRRVVDERAVAAAARELATHHDLALLHRESRLVERGRHAAVGHGEHRFHGGALGVGADHVGRGAAAARQEEGVDQDGLAGAGLAGEDVEAGGEGDGNVLDDREVSDPQLAQHPPTMLGQRGASLKTYLKRWGPRHGPPTPLTARGAPGNPWRPSRSR